MQGSSLRLKHFEFAFLLAQKSFLKQGKLYETLLGLVEFRDFLDGSPGSLLELQQRVAGVRLVLIQLGEILPEEFTLLFVLLDFRVATVKGFLLMANFFVRFQE